MKTAADYETLARSMMTAAELALIGTPCQVCREPLTAVTVHTNGTTCGSCRSGDSPVDRRPGMTTMAAILLPLLAG
jgi:hypothetical protein